MKNVFLVGLLLSVSLVMGQSDKGDFTLAPQVGLNLSNYSSSENLSNKIRVAFNAGVIGEYYFSNRWSLRTGLVYDSKGTRIEEAGEEFIDKLNYISLPLHANWHFGSGRNWFLNFGPTLNFLSSAKADIPEGEIDIKDTTNSFDIGLGLGIGYKFNLDENTEFFLQYQGYNGFVNVTDDLPIDLKNATSAFNIGVIFKL
ncbi:porin family protein [Winogradskyella jejuensis]|uniref:Outer membrane protein beta-barrel domain-containing protein n=1 Tax=Winogradskyella jejuensis TaxID=1089305 RepID=A0A1M5TFX8_9FLAO|nr:porin family protein [Winogradskyella jejuensis]SHH49578.1 Outer membrane protein beta-barrel domain-containing protein [Winogradskyella jejuensis]